MRPLLIALGILSTLVMAQSVLASTRLTSWPEPALQPLESALESSREAAVESAVLSEGRDIPSAASLVLLFAGISGLAAVGDRRGGRLQAGAADA